MQERIPFPACPLCESREIAPCFTGDCSRHALYQPGLSAQIHWMKCAACEHVFTDGYFTEAACQLIFSRVHDNQKIGYELEGQRILSSHIVEKVLPYVASGRWLDVGFGNGSLLFTAQEYGFTPIGTDLRTDNAKAMASLGVETHPVDLAELNLSRPCAVISLADVLEHMPYPKQGLAAAHRLLADDGVLFVSMPNSESVVWKAMNQGGSNPYWGEIEHYHNFSRSRLYALLDEAGFTPLRYGISERYRACMEVIARKTPPVTA
jgi:SAM-dependent methyltransferase